VDGVQALELSAPTSVEPMLSRQVMFEDGVARQIRNDYSFPLASVVRFRYPAKGSRPAVDLVWHEGGLHPPVPAELEAAGRELPAEGMMFVGDKGKIVSGFRVENPRLIAQGKYHEPPGGEPPPGQRRRPQREPGELSPGLKQWIAACRGGQQSPVSFLNASGIAEAQALYGVALRVGRKIVYDAQTTEVKNVPEANRYLAREYRKGWEPKA
jgi:hypothetical protein